MFEDKMRRIRSRKAGVEWQEVMHADVMTSLARLIELLRAETLGIINVLHRTQNPEMETDIETLIRTLGERCSQAGLTEVVISDAYTNSTPPSIRLGSAPRVHKYDGLGNRQFWVRSGRR
jgi:hypothetical protein